MQDSSLRRRDQDGERSTLHRVTYPRKRAVLACENCRIRKVKCNNERPVCSSCSRLGASCSYDERLSYSALDPASLLILGKLEEVLAKLDREGGSLLAANPWHAPLKANSLTDQRVGIPPPATSNATETELYVLDGLQVPTSFGSTDWVAAWPIFENRFPRESIIEELLISEHLPCQPMLHPNGRTGPPKFSTRGVHEEDIPVLVDRFLHYVHTKNPILDPAWVRRKAAAIVENGLDWNADCCIVLLACALGAISGPFVSSTTTNELTRTTSNQGSAGDRKLAEAYFNTASRRLGLLDRSIVACQCHLLAAIYLMYTVQPLQAWTHFHQALSTYTLYLKGQEALQKRSGSSEQPPDTPSRRLEQRLFWSCFKSECELRMEIDLPASGLSTLGYPYMFPSPPTPSSPSHVQQAASQGAGLTPLSSNTNLQSPSSPTTGLISFQKAEEQSWFYYLSEIALRRIQNRVLHAFYRDGPHTWSRNNIFDMARSAASFEMQLEAWQHSLPEPIQFKDRAVPELDELRSVTRGRYLGILGVVYRPFLYFAIHHPHDQSFEIEQLIRPLIRKGLTNLVEATQNLSVEHRHHGTWLKCRGVATFALVLLATKRGGLFPEDANANYQHIDPDFSVDKSVQKCVDGLKLWERESPDIAKAVEVIQSLQQESATR